MAPKENNALASPEVPDLKERTVSVRDPPASIISPSGSGSPMTQEEGASISAATALSSPNETLPIEDNRILVNISGANDSTPAEVPSHPPPLQETKSCTDIENRKRGRSRSKGEGDTSPKRRNSKDKRSPKATSRGRSKARSVDRNGESCSLARSSKDNPPITRDKVHSSGGLSPQADSKARSSNDPPPKEGRLTIAENAASEGIGKAKDQHFGDTLIGKLLPPERTRTDKGGNRLGGKAGTAGVEGVWSRKGQFCIEEDFSAFNPSREKFSTKCDPAFDTGIMIRTGKTFEGRDLLPSPKRGPDELVGFEDDEFRINGLSLKLKKPSDPGHAQNIDFSALSDGEDNKPDPERQHSFGAERDSGFSGLSEDNCKLLRMYQFAQKAVREEQARTKLNPIDDIDNKILETIKDAKRDPSENNVLSNIRQLSSFLVTPKLIRTGDSFKVAKKLHAFLASGLSQIIASLPYRMLNDLETSCLVLLSKIVSTQGIIPLNSDLNKVLTSLGLKPEVVSQFCDPLTKVYGQWFRSTASVLRFPVLEGNCAAIPWAELVGYIDEIGYSEYIGVIDITDKKISAWAKEVQKTHGGTMLVKETIAVILNIILTQSKYNLYKEHVDHIQIQPWFSLDLSALRWTIEKKFAIVLVAATSSHIIKTVAASTLFDLSQFPLRSCIYTPK